MCKFCDSMKVYRQCDEVLKQDDPSLEHRYSVAIIKRVFRKGQRGCRGSSMDARYNGCGFELNYCPECGQPMNKKLTTIVPHQTGTFRNVPTGDIVVDEEKHTASVTLRSELKYEYEGGEK